MPLQPKSIKTSPSPDGFATIIYGDAGAGKTTLLDSLPTGKLLIVSIEAGLSVLNNDHKFEECLMPSPKNPTLFTAKIRQIYEFLRFEDHPYEFVAIDSSSEMEKFLQYSQCAISSKTIPTLRHYGEAASLMRKSIMEFRDLKKSSGNKIGQPVNPIFVAGSFPLETMRTADQVTTRRFPMLTKKFSQEICGLVDVVGHLEVDRNESRILRFNPTEEVMAKTRYRCLSNIVQTGTNKLNFFEQCVKPIQAEIRSKLSALAQPQKLKTFQKPLQKPIGGK